LDGGVAAWQAAYGLSTEAVAADRPGRIVTPVAQTAHGAITASLTLLETSKGRAGVPRASLVRLERMLQTLTETHARWTKEGRAGQLPVSEEDLRLAAGRVRRLRIS
jgi:hypothetical protein